MYNVIILVSSFVVSFCAPAPQVPYRYGNPYGNYFQPEEMEVENEFGEGLGPRPNPPIPIPGIYGMRAGTGPQAGAGGAGAQVAYEPPDFEDIYNYQLMTRQAGGQGAAGISPYGMPALTQADFTKFDANNDGAIDYNDLFQATRYAEDKEEIFNTFRGSDINFDGRVSRNEFFTFPLEWQRLVLENNYYEQLYNQFYAPPQPPPKPPVQTQISRGTVHGRIHSQVQGRGQPSGKAPAHYSDTKTTSQPIPTQGVDVYPTVPVHSDTMAVDGNYTESAAGNDTYVYDYDNFTTNENVSMTYDGHPIDTGIGVNQHAGMGQSTADSAVGSFPAVETSTIARTEPGMDAAGSNARYPAIGAAGAQSGRGVATAPQKQPVGQPQRGADVPKQPVIHHKQTGIPQSPRMGGAGAGRPTYPQVTRPASHQYPQQPPRQPQQPPRPQQPRQQPPQRPQQQPYYNPYQYPFIDPEDYAEYLTYKQFYPSMLGGQTGQQGGQQAGAGGFDPYMGQYNPLMDEEGGMSLEKVAKFQAYDRYFAQSQGQSQGHQGAGQGDYNPYGYQEPAYNPYAQDYSPYGQGNPNLYPPYFD